MRCGPAKASQRFACLEPRASSHRSHFVDTVGPLHHARSLLHPLLQRYPAPPSHRQPPRVAELLPRLQPRHNCPPGPLLALQLVQPHPPFGPFFPSKPFRLEIEALQCHSPIQPKTKMFSARAVIRLMTDSFCEFPTLILFSANDPRILIRYCCRVRRASSSSFHSFLRPTSLLFLDASDSAIPQSHQPHRVDHHLERHGRN